MKSTIGLIVSLLLVHSGFAQQAEARLSVDFKIRNLGIHVSGHFDTTSITTNFDHEDISQWVLYGHVAVPSISTGNSKRDTHLNSEDYFDSKNYPEINLVATNFEELTKNKYTVTFDLTIKKTTKSIRVPIDIIGSNEGMTLRSYFEINRLDFEVGESSFALSNTVKITVKYSLKNE